jgi:glycosyltransferase involved in cell wall biosynthesis
VKIAYAYPTYWPYVRRGAERCIHDLTSYLAGRGHEIDIITSKPGRGRTVHDGNVRIMYLPEIAHPLTYRYTAMARLYGFGFGATPILARGKYDVAHLWSYSSVSLAPFLTRFAKLPYLFHLIMKEHHWQGRIDRLVYRFLVKHAARVAALTPRGADEHAALLGREVSCLPAPVDMEAFKPWVPKDLDRPQVLFTGDLGDPRKGSALLLRAWNEVHRRVPEAVLVLAGPYGIYGFEFEYQVYTLENINLVTEPSARSSIEVRGPGSVRELPLWYSQASVTVLPSVDEAFGLVVTESLASGTPVVCSSKGGPGEIISDPAVGATVPLETAFDLWDVRCTGMLADAIVQGIELARRPETVKRCREWAETWSLERVGAQTEKLLEEVAAA